MTTVIYLKLTISVKCPSLACLSNTHCHPLILINLGPAWTVWIGTIQSITLFIFGAASGAIIEKLGYRLSFIMGMLFSIQIGTYI